MANKKDIRRETIISMLSTQESVDRKQLYTDIGMSKNRFSETIKELEDMGYQFDTSKRGFISLVSSPTTEAKVYESITEPILRRWILLFRLSTISEIKNSRVRTGYNDHALQKDVYRSMCIFYTHALKLTKDESIPYSVNLFNRDVNALYKCHEVAHDLRHIYKPCEEKDLFRLSVKPFLVVVNHDMARKLLFALEYIHDDYDVAPIIAKRILDFYPDINYSKPLPSELPLPKITNVYDRISILMSFLSNREKASTIEELSKKTGISIEQIKKDLTYIKGNKLGQLIYDEKGLKLSNLLSGITKYSSLYDLYSGKQHRVIYLPVSEHLLFMELRNLHFIWDEAYSHLRFTGALKEKYNEIESDWDEQNL